MGLRKTLKRNIIQIGIPRWGEPYLRKKFIRGPIIIGGCGRSGTTVLLSILGAHPHIYAINEETEALCPTAHREDNVDLDAPLVIDKIYWYLLTHNVPRTCNRWCEKTPKNVIYFGRILDYFGDSVRIVHIVRDGRDVITSKHPDKQTKYWVPPERWINDVEAGLQYENHPQVLTIKYEDLVGRPEETIKKICTFIEEDFHESLLSHSDHTHIKRDKAWYTEAEPLHQRSVGKWRRPEFKERIDLFMNNPHAVRLLTYFRYM